MTTFSQEETASLIEEGFEIEYYDLSAQAAYAIDESNEFNIRANSDGTYTASFYSYDPEMETTNVNLIMDSVPECIDWIFSQIQEAQEEI